MMIFELFAKLYALPCEWLMDRPGRGRGAGAEKRRQGQCQLYLIKGGNKEETKPESSRRHEEMFGVIKAHDITPRKTHVNGHYLGYPSTVNVCIKYTYLLQLLLPIGQTTVLKLPLLFGHKVELSSLFFWQSYRGMFRLILPPSISWQLKLIVNTKHTPLYSPRLKPNLTVSDSSLNSMSTGWRGGRLDNASVSTCSSSSPSPSPASTTGSNGANGVAVTLGVATALFVCPFVTATVVAL